MLVARYKFGSDAVDYVMESSSSTTEESKDKSLISDSLSCI
jgi:hypothetical protein